MRYRHHHLGTSFREATRRSSRSSRNTGPSLAVEALAAKADLLLSEVVDADYILAQIKADRSEAPPIPGAPQEPTPAAIHHMTA